MTEPTWDGTRWSDDAPITDAEKHAFCQRRFGHDAFFCSANLYAAAEKAGVDMRMWVVNKPIESTFHDMRMKPGYVAQGSITGRWPHYAKYGPSDAARWNDCPGARPEPEGQQAKKGNT